MFEYAILAQIAVLATSIGGLEARIAENLSLKDGAARKVAVAEARARKVPLAGARAAYARAPYKLPAQRALYASGWIAGVKTRASCVSVRLSPERVRARTAKQLRQDKRLRQSLGALRLSARAAAAAHTRGLLSSCG